jgi:hypothetical protein
MIGRMKLYRCITPTDRLCPCGKVARELTGQPKRIIERIQAGDVGRAST